MKEVYVIFDPFKGGYYDGKSFRGILFAKKYRMKENAVVDVQNILSSSFGTNFLKIEKFYTN